LGHRGRQITAVKSGSSGRFSGSWAGSRPNAPESHGHFLEDAELDAVEGEADEMLGNDLSTICPTAEVSISTLVTFTSAFGTERPEGSVTRPTIWPGVPK
jgi:hypothetical protein